MRNSSYNLILILLKLCRHCDHALKICMWLGYTAQINFYHFLFLFFFGWGGRGVGVIFTITVYQYIPKFPNENEIIWSLRGVRVNPLNPL